MSRAKGGSPIHDRLHAEALAKKKKKEEMEK
jgi:hypothetical protein